MSAHNLRIGRIFLAAGAALLLLVLVLIAATWYWDHQQAAFQNAPQLITALGAFCRDRAARGQRLPPQISLQDLLREGYLKAEDARAFDGMDVTFNTTASETQPPSILARARTRDGQYLCLLTDGSVQNYSGSQYQQMLTNSAAPSGQTNQLIRSETNQTSVPAGLSR